MTRVRMVAMHSELKSINEKRSNSWHSFKDNNIENVNMCMWIFNWRVEILYVGQEMRHGYGTSDLDPRTE